MRLPVATALSEAMGEVWGEGITRPSMSSHGSELWAYINLNVAPTNMRSSVLGLINTRAVARRMRPPALCSLQTTRTPRFTARTTHAGTGTCLMS